MFGDLPRTPGSLGCLRKLKNGSNSVGPGWQEIIQSNLSHHRDTKLSASLQGSRPTAASNQGKQTLSFRSISLYPFPLLALQSTVPLPRCKEENPHSFTTWDLGSFLLLSSPLYCFSESSAASSLIHWHFLEGPLAFAVCIKPVNFPQ